MLWVRKDDGFLGLADIDMNVRKLPKDCKVRQLCVLWNLRADRSDEGDVWIVEGNDNIEEDTARGLI